MSTEKSLMNELTEARRKFLLASVVVVSSKNMIRIRFNRTSDFEIKQAAIKKYILRTYPEVHDIGCVGTMMYIFV